MTNEYDLPRSLYNGILIIGDVEADCYVLDTTERVLSQRGLAHLLLGGGHKRGDFGQYLERIPFENNGLASESEVAINFPIIKFWAQGNVGNGYNSDTIINILEAYSNALANGWLRKNQMHIGARAVKIQSSLARLGIVAVIDEATGYQAVREKNDLEVRLAFYLREKPREYEKRYPDEMRIEAIRILKMDPETKHHPGPMARVFRKQIYDYILGADVASVLKERNPHPGGNHPHHTFVDDKVTRLIDWRIGEVLSQLKASDSWAEFNYNMDKMNKKIVTMDFFYESGRKNAGKRGKK